jgi:hypothetical protein
MRAWKFDQPRGRTIRSLASRLLEAVRPAVLYVVLVFSVMAVWTPHGGRDVGWAVWLALPALVVAAVASVTVARLLSEQRSGLPQRRAFRVEELGERSTALRPAMANLDLRGIDLDGADLRRADLRGTRLEGATLVGALLDGAQLTEARLDGASLASVRMAGADLRGARLRDADLRVADLQGADLRSADLRGAMLFGADLTGSMLEGAVITEAQLRVTRDAKPGGPYPDEPPFRP